MRRLLFLSTTTAFLATACGTSNPPGHPAGFPLRYHDTKTGFTFYLPETWRGYSVLHNEWLGQTYVPANDENITVTRGPVFVLRHPHWTASKMYQDMTLVVYTRSQWDGEKQGTFSCTYFAGGTMVELWHNHNYVLAMSTHEGKAELEGWQEVNEIVSQNVQTSPPHVYPQ
jgi:hypothetical protein